MTELDAIRERLQAEGHAVTIIGLVAEPAAAVVLGVAPGTLRNWRSQGHGPPWLKIRGRCWYSLPELLAWIDESTLHDLSRGITGRHETSPITRRQRGSMKP